MTNSDLKLLYLNSYVSKNAGMLGSSLLSIALPGAIGGVSQAVADKIEGKELKLSDYIGPSSWTSDAGKHAMKSAVFGAGRIPASLIALNALTKIKGPKTAKAAQALVHLAGFIPELYALSPAIKAAVKKHNNTII